MEKALTKQIKQALFNKTKNTLGYYGAEEVSFQSVYLHNKPERADYVEWNGYSEITCYEIKISKSDLNSDNKLSAFGSRNYIVVPSNLVDEAKAFIQHGKCSPFFGVIEAVIDGNSHDSDKQIYFKVVQSCHHNPLTPTDLMAVLDGFATAASRDLIKARTSKSFSKDVEIKLDEQYDFLKTRIKTVSPAFATITHALANLGIDASTIEWRLRKNVDAVAYELFDYQHMKSYHCTATIDLWSIASSNKYKANRLYSYHAVDSVFKNLWLIRAKEPNALTNLYQNTILQYYFLRTFNNLSRVNKDIGKFNITIDQNQLVLLPQDLTAFKFCNKHLLTMPYQVASIDLIKQIMNHDPNHAQTDKDADAELRCAAQQQLEDLAVKTVKHFVNLAKKNVD